MSAFCLPQRECLIILGQHLPKKNAMSHIPLKTVDLFVLISNLDSKSLDQDDCDLLACVPCGNHHRNRLLNQRQTNRAGLLPLHKSELVVSG